jgi:excinuclease ABC subunit A
VKQIIIKGARENNLKNVDLTLPRDQLIVITGLSGSGKSSLAFDTIYAEGQRRYVESLSSYARQFLEQKGKPEVDLIEGLSPAISIEQRGLSKNPRSTVGTVTEIYDYLRLLYARVGQPHCPGCGQVIASQSVQQMVDQLLSHPEGTRLSVLAPVIRERQGDFRLELEQLRRDGYSRVKVDGEVLDLNGDVRLEVGLHTIEVYVDRLVLKAGIESRLSDSLELALKLAGGLVKILLAEGAELLFSEKLACGRCGLSFPELTPRSFSFNNPVGACPRCLGLGVLMEFDEDRIVPRPELSLREGAIAAWATRHSAYYQELLEALAAQFDFDLFVPYAQLANSVKQLLMFGSEVKVEHSFEREGRRYKYHRPFEGVIRNLQRRLEAQERRQKEGAGAHELQAFDSVVDEFHPFMRQRSCEECGGSRLRAEARQVLLARQPIHAVVRLSIGEALDFFTHLELTGRARLIAHRLLREITSRLSFLVSVGLDYLSLDRSSATLSGGEGQRVRLATQIGSQLIGVLYILDEPSLGLHSRDHRRLLQTLLKLRDLGNTVIVVEHDEETIRAADFVVDLGPGAGQEGGEVVAAGTVAEVSAKARSLTGQFLAGARSIAVPAQRRKAQHWITISGARSNNLKDLKVKVPLGVLTCVTGVSGSGKSTLIIDTLLPLLRHQLHGTRELPGVQVTLEGAHWVDQVISIDQSPIGRTPRSNPATYIGLFAPLRQIFAGLPESKVRGYKAGRYSFNVKGGRCESCQGEGILRIAMHFLPDVFVPCEACGGRRYNRETLQVKYKGFSIADLLSLTVAEAYEVLQRVPQLRTKLLTLREVGLGYLTLGQPANTLSGGEAQRLKLSKELSRRSTGQTLYILDEPTSGLHLADIQVMLQVLTRLVEAGNSVVVIEHQLDVVKSADYLIDLGPEGGAAGGRLVAAGTPEEVAAIEESFTGRALRPLLGLKPSAAP